MLRARVRFKASKTKGEKVDPLKITERAATGVRNSAIKAYPPTDRRCDHLGQLLRDVSGVLLVDRERKQSERASGGYARDRSRFVREQKQESKPVDKAS
ncbi:unnamed protein product [Lasius platythorax]|uniref:Uncharacterized protein n=1 Tax=Lasius platythorax TaxID=488582 RepID=A0AAV2P376_9HYME